MTQNNQNQNNPGQKPGQQQQGGNPSQKPGQQQQQDRQTQHQRQVGPGKHRLDRAHQYFTRGSTAV